MPIQVIAHRGASGLEHENSRAAFRRAVALGADAIELDVHATLDGAFVVHHDPTLPGAGAISQMRARDVTALRLANGEPVPLLGDVLEFTESVELWIEVKALDERLDDALLEVLRGAPRPERCAIHSFDHRIVARLGPKDPGRRLGALLAAYLIDPIAALVAAGAGTLWQEHQLIDRELVDRVHASGRRIIAWTVNDTPDVSRLAELGIDGLCGNFPDRIRRTLALSTH
jgi:glycerophosphoryl diester phosphodiesterase